jgi:hypothetical protein
MSELIEKAKEEAKSTAGSTYALLAVAEELSKLRELIAKKREERHGD